MNTQQPEALRLANAIQCVDSACKCSMNLAAAELRLLHAENEALLADAERYRWLREADEMADALIKSDCRGVYLPQREALDSQIDAARKEGDAG